MCVVSSRKGECLNMTKMKMSSKRKVSNRKVSNRKPKPNLKTSSKMSYVNVNRSSKTYKDKYKKDVEKAVLEFANGLGKQSGKDLTKSEWKNFYKTVLIPLDGESERHMIDLFVKNRPELNNLLVLHNIKAGNNIAEVYYKKYTKESPTQWHDLEDFKQMALEGLVIAADRFDVTSGNRFLTYATWWMLNRVLHPNQEKGAFVNHTSFSSLIGGKNDSKGDDNSSTFEDIFTSKLASLDWNAPNDGNPVDVIDAKDVNDKCELYDTVKRNSAKNIKSVDANKFRDMTKYLMSLVDQSSGSYDDEQIYLYMFKRVFNKYSAICKNDSAIDKKKLKSYIAEAAASKSELLDRLHMNEEQYEELCDKLMKRGYNGGSI